MIPKVDTAELLKKAIQRGEEILSNPEATERDKRKARSWINECRVLLEVYTSDKPRTSPASDNKIIERLE